MKILEPNQFCGLKKKIFLFWDGEWEAGIPAREAVIEVDTGSLLEFCHDQEDLDDLEACLLEFSKVLRNKFDADHAETEKSLADLQKWCDEEEKKL